ncbi:YkgJ family cysteine cluster protein [Cupriavidus alkaliphilus]|uniref:YkgJ family cysteine cluster protein n=1 Tax=Cupriavidus alkaliphilus TaxID=942866 RepID=UPI000DD6769E|nr:YkgJ family cysteine cluster protein [Cupriavidus alkaliphilus]
MSCRSDLSCRAGCGACCIAPSIASPLPGMPHGKPGGVPCAQLLPDMRCAVFGSPDRPAFCAGLKPSAEMCGDSREAALQWLARLEILTAPQAHP